MIAIFADLDDTLFQTRRKLPPNPPEPLLPATLDTQDQPHSFCTPSQTALLRLLQSLPETTLIPVTGRDQAAFGRVLLPFSSWRVLDHGLTILDADGNAEPRWAERIHAELEPLQAALQAGTEFIRPQALALGCTVRIHQAQGLPFMTVLKHPEAAAEPLRQLREHWAQELNPASPLHLIANGNQVSLLPKALGKAEAVQYLLDTHFPEHLLSLGLGDSVSDLPFLSVCDFALTPKRGQLLRVLQALELPHV